MLYSRRDFGMLAAAGLGGLLYAPEALAKTKPNSRIAGVQIGTMVPNSLRGVDNDLYAYRDALLKIGLSGCETHNEPFEKFVGAPQPAAAGPGGGRGGPGGASPDRAAAQKAQQDALTAWRLSTPMSRFKAARKIWNDSGIKIYAFKIPLTLTMPDEEYDYAFNLAKTMGASQLTMELPSDPALSARVGKFGEKHRMPVGYHAERPTGPGWWDTALAQSPCNNMNLDVGHFVANANTDVLEFMRAHHARIVSLHLKDYKRGGGSMPWGQGDTPIAPILHLIRDQKWGFPVTIELDYAIPAGSTMTDEVAKCLGIVRAALLS